MSSLFECKIDPIGPIQYEISFSYLYFLFVDLFVSTFVLSYLMQLQIASTVIVVQMILNITNYFRIPENSVAIVLTPICGIWNSFIINNVISFGLVITMRTHVAQVLHIAITIVMMVNFIKLNGFNLQVKVTMLQLIQLYVWREIYC